MIDKQSDGITCEGCNNVIDVQWNICPHCGKILKSLLNPLHFR